MTATIPPESASDDPRWDALPPATMRALQLAAVLGQTFELHDLFALGITPANLDAAFDAGLLREQTQPQVCFASETLHRQVLERTAWSERRQLNGQVAELLLQQGAAPQDIAPHLAAAHRYEEASDCWRTAGEQACAEQRFEDARHALTEALRLYPGTAPVGGKRRILRAMATCCERAGHAAPMADICREILKHAEDDVAAAMEAHRRLARLTKSEGDGLESLEHLHSAAKAAASAGDPASSAAAWLEYGSALLEAGRIAESRRALEQAYTDGTDANNITLRIHTAGDLALALAIMGQHEQAANLATGLMELALGSGRHDLVAYAYRRQANISDYRGDYPAERDHHLAALERCRLQPGVDGEHTCLACLSYTFVRTGEWARALETAQDVLQRDAHPVLKSMALIAPMLVHTFRGNFRRGGEVARDALAEFRKFGLGAFEFFPLWSIAFLHEQAEEPQQAGIVYREIRTLWRQSEDLHDVVPALLFASGWYADNKDAEALADCVDITTTIAARNAVDECRAANQAALAEQAALQGDPARAQAAYQEAAAALDRVASPIECVYLRWRWWRFLSLQGEAAQAGDVAEPALTLARRLGMRPFLERFQQTFWTASGPTREAPTTEGLLTRRQIEVLRAAGEGLTDKETAARFRLSVRTVEMHMAHALERLNCRTRTEAVRKATDAGWLD